ncbi:MAG: type II toxin-antitoxin system PemK/MazF family toxin [Spirochaetaceae bacterium]|nr:MAG: type II toxin-antitoxin system PemK/MazF family toxin [Spirochaetaceae bacterium]
MARILRGQIRWADLNPTIGHERAGFPLTLSLEGVKLPKPSWVKISQIRTLSVERIGASIGHVSDDILNQVTEGLNEIIG